MFERSVCAKGLYESHQFDSIDDKRQQLRVQV